MTGSRAGGGRPPTRGQPVIDRVHRATLERLAEVGFERLSIPDIADRARLNKTSVYRRWRTKQDLVRDAMLSSMHGDHDSPDTGAIRDDMLALVRSAAEFARSPLGMGALRTLLAEGVALAVDAPGDLFGRGGRDVVGQVIDRAVVRGELPRGIDMPLLASTIAGAVLQRVLVEQQPLADEYLESLIDLVLAGARATARPDHAVPAPDQRRRAWSRPDAV